MRNRLKIMKEKPKMAETKVASKAPAKQESAKKKGRPSGYTEEMGQTICNLLSEGLSLRKACKVVQSNISNVRRWLLANPAFRTQYARAREEQADYYADEIIDIADGEGLPDQKRVRIEARKWIACKLHPRVYGEKLNVTARDETPTITQEWMIETMRRSPSFLLEVEKMVAEAKSVISSKATSVQK
jgi:hypothetical protein